MGKLIINSTNKDVSKPFLYKGKKIVRILGRNKIATLQRQLSNWKNDQPNLNDEHMYINGVNYGDRAFIAIGSTDSETRTGFSQDNAYLGQAVKYGHWERKQSVFSSSSYTSITYSSIRLIEAMNNNPNIADLTTTIVLTLKAASSDFWVFAGENDSRKLAKLSFRREEPGGQITTWIQSPKSPNFTKINLSTITLLWDSPPVLGFGSSEIKLWISHPGSLLTLKIEDKIKSGVSTMYVLKNEYRTFI